MDHTRKLEKAIVEAKGLLSRFPPSAAIGIAARKWGFPPSELAREMAVHAAAHRAAHQATAR